MPDCDLIFSLIVTIESILAGICAISALSDSLCIRGSSGGYILDKPASEIKLSNIIFAVNEEVRMLNCKKQSKKGCTNKTTKCITHNLWDHLDQHINGFFEKNTLKDIIIRTNKVQQKELN